MNFVLDLEAQRLQPLVLLDDDLYIPTRAREGHAILVTAAGVEHPLRRFCPWQTLAHHHESLNEAECHRILAAELASARGGNRADPVACFMEDLAPSFAAGRWHGAPESVSPDAEVRSALATLPKCVPLAKLPNPALWIFGRAWLLSAITNPVRRVHVRRQGRHWALTGEYVTARTIRSDCDLQATSFLKQEAATLAGRLAPAPNEALPRARAGLANAGFLQAGDLLLIDLRRGQPLWLAHVLPPHFNHTFGQFADRTLAIGTSFELPAKIGALAAFQKDERGRWSMAVLPKGVCLGVHQGMTTELSAPMMVARYLAWAAVRIAGNGLFHEYDLQDR